MTETDTDIWKYSWVHLTDTGFVCDHCGQTRSLVDRSFVRSEFKRECYDFLLRHKHCRAAVVQ